MVISLIMQMLLVISAPILIMNNAPIALILLIVFLFGSFDLISWTGYQIFIAESVTDSELSTVSGQVGLISSVQKTFGPGIAAIVINLINYLGGFLLDALSFGYLTYVIKDYKPINKKVKSSNKKGTFKSSAKEGLNFLYRQHTIKWFIASFFVANIGFQSVIPMLTYLLKQSMHVSVNMVSVFFTIAAISSITGNFVYIHLNKKIKLGFQVITIGLILALGFLTMLNVNSFVLVTLGYAIVSFGSVWAQANFFTVIQSRTPDKYKGTITSIATSLTRIIGPIMSLLSGIMIKFEVHSIFLVAAFCMILSVVISFTGKLNKLE